MELTIGTPALLFSTVSLLMIAFTNRFLAIANLIRELHDKFKIDKSDKIIVEQIKNLQKRLVIIRNVQIISISSLLLCAFSMSFIFFQEQNIAKWLFAGGLSLQILALIMSVLEITMSMSALKIELSDMED